MFGGFAFFLLIASGVEKMVPRTGTVDAIKPGNL
jgi:hypothetical protein